MTHPIRVRRAKPRPVSGQPLLGGSGRFSERLMAIDDKGHAELLNELRDVRREIDSIPKKWELRLVAYVILGAVGVPPSIAPQRPLVGPWPCPHCQLAI
jgi:hypothetical protein